MTGYPRQFVVRGYSITCAPFADVLRDNEFVSECARKAQDHGGKTRTRLLLHFEQLGSPSVPASPDPDTALSSFTPRGTHNIGSAPPHASCRSSVTIFLEPLLARDQLNENAWQCSGQFNTQDQI